MREIKFVPSLAKGKDATFEGHLIILAPSLGQRAQYIEDCAFELDDEGKVKISTKNFGVMAKMVALAKPHVKEVKLKLLKDGTEYKSYEEMEYDNACDNILYEVGGVLLNGFHPAKN